MRMLLSIFSTVWFPAEVLAEGSEPQPQRDDSWKLVWADEFNRDGSPDARVWQFENGFVRNKELQWYQPANAVCRDGVLVIEARREQVKNPGYGKAPGSWQSGRTHANYTSASIVTRENFAWKYGRFEIRARFPSHAGLWPAIWTTGGKGWPHGGEIDIMEYYRDQILANTVHAGKGGKALWNTAKHPIRNFNPGTWNQEFHLWVMEWDENEIAIYLDGRLLNRIDISTITNLDGPAINPFRAPQRMRLNLAIGSNGGDTSKTPFPQHFEVDYVRIYQKKPGRR